MGDSVLVSVVLDSVVVLDSSGVVVSGLVAGDVEVSGFSVVVTI